ncbi:hypothetical protein A3E49_02925 [Candidatus Saccharibacteria bacterium RIFCSPHIGHO2_12_FULL_49_19]|nr:MAG: hypothetical protein A3E49_02925 [Candidatus Saccharibacteria bacterium RIFCSPHIGHO2_12_FULL_49_19]OGL38055.1 MAG: hypothetical protein A3B63_02395 [Candidatus Saccharibacteria bacterium RIFCSPLOWO2_01_FULL_49_22]
MINIKRLLLFGSLFAVIIGIAIFFWYRGSFGNVQITLPSGVSAKIIVAQGEHRDGDEDGAVATFSDSYSDNLRKSFYTLITQGTSEYEGETLDFEVSSNPVIINLTPDYTEEKLDTLLSSSHTEIIEAFKADFPTIPEEYTLVSGRLFGQGDWYGGTLIPSDQLNKDILRFVANRRSGTWVIVTKPPQIIVSSVLHPEIPKDIVRGVNKL